MTKAELISAIADTAGVSKADAERTVQSFFDVVVKETSSGAKVAWPGFGAFSITKRAARQGRNPRTGEVVQIKASKAMKFTSAAGLKTQLNK